MFTGWRTLTANRLFTARRGPRLAGRSGRKSARPTVEVLESRTLLSGGDLDPTFGAGGKVVNNSISTAVDAAVQPDRKILIAGYSSGPILTRYNGDGSLDTTFGNGGQVSFSLPGGATVPGPLALQSDGKILFATGIDLMRLNANGSLDSGFGANGRIANLFGGFPPSVLALQADGSILITHSSDNPFDGEQLVRYHADGTPDPSFSTSFVRILFDSVVVQADGKIVAAAVNELKHTTPELVRFNVNGTIDADFSSNLPPLPSDGAISNPAIQADGKIVIAITSFFVAGQDQANLYRLNADGTPDRTFGRGGQIPLDTSFVVGPYQVALGPDGTIVVFAANPLGVDQNTLRAYKPNGSPQRRFGNNGHITVDFGKNTDVTHLVAEPDGKIVVAGDFGFNGFTSSLAVARYLPAESGPPTNEIFVHQLYLDLLQRPADPGGMATWVAALDQGASRSQIVQAFENSAEYHALLVERLYQRVFQRNVDPSGQTAWVNFLNRGGTAEQLEAMLLGSDEFFATHGTNNQSFLSGVYQVVLQRPIDPSGAQSWGQALQSGTMSRQAVAAAIVASNEADQLAIQNDYAQYLLRKADTGGFNMSLHALQRGLIEAQLVAVLLSSAEYFAEL